jgi:hypothetical protein
MGSDHELNPTIFDVFQLIAPSGGRCGAGDERDAKARALQQPRDVGEVLLGENFRRRHERDLESVLHGDNGGQQRDDRFSGTDVSLQQAVHRRRPLQVLDDLLERLPLAAREPEWQNAAGRLTNPIVDHDRLGLALDLGGTTAGVDADLEEKRLLEDQALLRRSLEPVQCRERRIIWREMSTPERRGTRGQLESSAGFFGKVLGELGGQSLQGVEHKAPLHLGRYGARPLVDRHDSAGVNRGFLSAATGDALVGVSTPPSCAFSGPVEPLPHVLPDFVVTAFRSLVLLEDLVLRIGDLQPAVSSHLELSVEHDVLADGEYLAQERLVEPDRAQRAGRVADERLEDLEAGTPRGSQPATEHSTGKRRRLTWLERRDWCQVAAILVTNRKAIQEIFERDQPRALEIRGATWADTLQVLEGRRQDVCGRAGPFGPGRRGHCTIMA